MFTSAMWEPNIGAVYENLSGALRSSLVARIIQVWCCCWHVLTVPLVTEGKYGDRRHSRAPGHSRRPE